MGADGSKNLVPFKKGYDPRRNYDGQPKIPDIKDIREAFIEKLIETGETGKSKFEEMVDSLIEKAALGNERAAAMVIDRVWKKLSQDLVLTGKDGDPIQTEEKKTWFIALRDPEGEKPKRKYTKKNAE